MLDRAGFCGAEQVFRIEGDARRPRAVLDFATGLEGFLVESARRIADEAIGGDAQTIEEGLEAIVRGLHGCEISPFPYYLTEVTTSSFRSLACSAASASSAPQRLASC